MELTYNDFIDIIGLTYEDTEWRENRFLEILNYFKKDVQKAIAVFDDEKDKILGDYEKCLYWFNKIHILQMDVTDISENIKKGHGHSKVGTINILEKQYVYKEMSNINISNDTLTRINIIQEFNKLCNFVNDSIQLHRSVQGIVEIFPYLIISLQGSAMQLGIIMEIISGETLIDIYNKDKSQYQSELKVLQKKYQSKHKIYRLRTLEILNKLKANNYGFSDFEYDNIIYDEKTDTLKLIDINPSDFNRAKRYIDDSISSITNSFFHKENAFR